MRKVKVVRNASFVLTVFLVCLAAQRDLLAFSSVPSECTTWGANYDCNCNVETWPAWEASGVCDFSETPDPEGLANEYCIAMFDACANDCESSSYVDWLISENCDPNDPNDPACYEECWITWAGSNSCDVATVASFSCSCSSLNWCE